MKVQLTSSHFIHAFLVAMSFIVASPACSLAGDSFVGERKSLYETVNKDWLSDTPIPDDKPGVSNFLVLADGVDRSLKSFMELTDSAKKFSAHEKKARDLYSSYLNFSHREKTGITPLEKELRDIDSAGDLEGVFRLFPTLLKIGVSTPLIWDVGPDFQNSGAHLLWLRQSGLGLPARSMYLEQDERSQTIRKNYVSYLSALFTLAEISDAEQQAQSVLQFEQELAKLQWSPEQLRDYSKQYNLLSVSELTGTMGLFPVEKNLQALGLPTDVPINASQLSYIRSLREFFSSQSIGVWKSYLRARLLFTYAPLLNEAFHQRQVEYQKSLGLLKSDLPDWKRALAFVKSCSPHLLGRVYVENYFSEETKKEATAVIEDIRASAAETIHGSRLLGTETKEKALKKLAAMEFAVGYPEVWPDFDTFQTNSEDPISNFKMASLFELRRNYSKAKKPVDKREWENSPHEVNAGYDPTQNRFVVHAAILQPPFFDAKGTLAVKYGGFGFVVGHEIGHAFDDMGSQFDSVGNMVNWWTEADRAAYNKVKEAIIAQANAFEILPGVHLNGALQVGEIMGDMTGSRLALNVLEKKIAARKLNRIQTQREFFSQLARVWREKLRPEVQRLIIATDPHPPGKFRTDGVVKNMPEFHAAFGTRPGDPMYQPPRNRAQIW